MKENQLIINQTIEEIHEICNIILEKGNYLQKMSNAIGDISKSVELVLAMQENGQEKVIQVLEDMMYGMSQQDDVFLLDVLRFGLLSILENSGVIAEE